MNLHMPASFIVIRRKRKLSIKFIKLLSFICIAILFVLCSFVQQQQQKITNLVYSNGTPSTVSNNVTNAVIYKQRSYAYLSWMKNPLNIIEIPVSLNVVEEDRLAAANSRFVKYAMGFFKNKPYAGAQTYIDYTITYLGLRPVENVKPLCPELNMMVVNDVTAFKYPIDIPKCKGEDGSIVTANRTLFIAILSAPNYFEKRQVIRETWLKHIRNSHYTRGLLDVVGYGFVVGQTSDQSVQSKIEEESKNNADILQVEMDDSYRNLTRKSVAIFNWVNSNCARTDFVLKVDDDVYFNVHNVATLLDELSPTETSVYGRYGEPSNICRVPSKWELTYEQWPWDKLPPFVLGSSNLVSGSAIRPLLAAAQVTPYLWPNGASEDVYINGILTEIAKVNITTSHLDRFCAYISANPDPCFVRDHSTWMTQNSTQIISSHSAVEKLYRVNSNVKCSAAAQEKGYFSSFDYIKPST